MSELYDSSRSEDGPRAQTVCSRGKRMLLDGDVFMLVRLHLHKQLHARPHVCRYVCPHVCLRVCMC